MKEYGHTRKAIMIIRMEGVAPLKVSFFKKDGSRGFPCGTVVENLPANAGDTGSSPGLGGSHMPRSN